MTHNTDQRTPRTEAEIRADLEKLQGQKLPFLKPEKKAAEVSHV